MHPRGWTLLTAALFLFAGCAAPEEGPPDEATDPGTTPDAAAPTAPEDYPELTFIATAERDDSGQATYAFEGPESAPAGWTRVTLSTDDVEPHQLVLLRLDQGVSYTELVESLDAQDGSGEDAYTLAGGVGAVSAGQHGTVLVELQEGEHAIVCLIPGPTGRPHVHDGQIMRFEVTPAQGEALPAPTPEATIGMRDYAYDLPAEGINASVRILAFHNEGAEAHEAPLVRLSEGATLEEFLHAIEAGEGPPPGELVGGVVGIPPQATGYAIVTLQADATHGVACFYPVGEDGPPHFMHGMLAEFTPR